MVWNILARITNYGDFSSLAVGYGLLFVTTSVTLERELCWKGFQKVKFDASACCVFAPFIQGNSHLEY